MSEDTPRKLSQKKLRKIAAAADCDPRTVLRWFAGLPLGGGGPNGTELANRIAIAARALDLAQWPQPSTKTAPAQVAQTAVKPPRA